MRYARVTIHGKRGVFMISVAAKLSGMHPQTLRIYEARGLIRPQRTARGTRLYSSADLARLRHIQELTARLGRLNLAGVEEVLALEDKIATLKARLARLETSSTSTTKK